MVRHLGLGSAFAVLALLGWIGADSGMGSIALIKATIVLPGVCAFVGIVAGRISVALAGVCALVSMVSVVLLAIFASKAGRGALLEPSILLLLICHVGSLITAIVTLLLPGAAKPRDPDVAPPLANRFDDRGGDARMGDVT